MAAECKPTVLVMDDDRAITNALVIMLDEMGFSGRGVYSLSGAISLLNEETPDLVIADDTLSGDGTTLCIELRSRAETAAVPIIMLADNLVTDVLKAGADVVLQKPASSQTIVELAKKLLANYEDFKRASRQKSDGSTTNIA
jgi:DNA-binding response OmpR family regulator